MKGTKINKVVATVGAAASITIGGALAGAATASAGGGVLAEWYPTYYDCVYKANVYAQQGLISAYKCPAENSGWVLYGWKY